MGLQIVKLLDPLNPTIVTGGLVPRGAYNGGTAYVVGDSVSYSGSSYVCILASTGNLPTNTTYWQVLANKGDTGSTGATGATGAAGVVQSIVAGNNIDVDNTDPANPVVAVETLTLADITDVTSSAAELNVLDGIPVTLTATELGYVDGVTSSIQTQLNSKISNLSTFDTDDLAEGTTNLYSQWDTDSPGIVYTGHIAIGANADVNGTGPVNSLLQDTFGIGTASSVLGVQEIFTGSPAIYNSGISIKAVSNFNTTPTTIMAIEALAATASGNTQGATILTGFFGGAAHRGTGTVTSAYGIPGIVENLSSGTITTGYGLFSAVHNLSSGTLTNGYGSYISNGANLGTYTNQYGSYIEPITGATNNYGLAVGAASTNTLWISNNADSTAATAGIVLGASKDTNLYRGAANTLKTDGSLEVADSAYSTSWNGSLKVPTRNAVYDKIESMEHRFLITNAV